MRDRFCSDTGRPLHGAFGGVYLGGPASGEGTPGAAPRRLRARPLAKRRCERRREDADLARLKRSGPMEVWLTPSKLQAALGVSAEVALSKYGLIPAISFPGDKLGLHVRRTLQAALDGADLR